MYPMPLYIETADSGEMVLWFERFIALMIKSSKIFDEHERSNWWLPAFQAIPSIHRTNSQFVLASNQDIERLL